MPLIERLAAHGGVLDDDEDAILQTIVGATDAELAAAPMSELLRHIGELPAADAYRARRRVWPHQAHINVEAYLREANGVFCDDEYGVSNALLDLTPAQRLTLWTEQQALFAMFSTADRAMVERMCTAATDADALRARMALATDGAGTDEEGVAGALAAAGQRHTQAAALDRLLDSGAWPDGRPLTGAERATLEQRRAEIGDIAGLLQRDQRRDGTLDPATFLGRVQDDMDSATVDSALELAGADDFERARQQMLMTIDLGGANVDEEAALAVLRGVADPMVRNRLRLDRALAPVWESLDLEEIEQADDIMDGDTFALAVRDLTTAFEHVDTDEAALLRTVTRMSEADRERLRASNPPILVRIRGYSFAEVDFITAFDEALLTGQIKSEHALAAAFGGDHDGTDEDILNDALVALDQTQRDLLRRGYVLARTRIEQGSVEVPPEDQPALDAYQALYTRMRAELEDEELDRAMQAMLGLPSVAEISTAAGRRHAATVMRLRQRERLEDTAYITDGLTTTDDTAEAAHVEFEARYQQALAAEDPISVEDFAILVHLDEQFDSRYRAYGDTANVVSDVAATVAAVVAAVVVVALSGGAGLAAAPGFASWLSANGTLIAGSALAGAVAEAGTAELMGGDFNEATGAEGARHLASGAIEGALAVCGAALAEEVASLRGLSGAALKAQIARSAVRAAETGVAGKAFARGALTGLIDGSLGGAVSELTMTLADAETWKRSVWGVLARAGAALLRGATIGAVTGGVAGGLAESASALLAARRLRHVTVEIDPALERGAYIDFDLDDPAATMTLRFGPGTTDADLAAHVDRVAAMQRALAVRDKAARLLTTAGHAEQEALKIRDLIEARVRELRRPMAPATRATIEDDLAVLERKLDEYLAVAASNDATPGSGRIGTPEELWRYPPLPEHHHFHQRDGIPGGYDLQLDPYAPEGTPRFTLAPDGAGKFRLAPRPDAPPPSPRFADRAHTPAQIHRELMEHNPSFVQFTDMLQREGIATRAEVIRRIGVGDDGAPIVARNRSHDDVRGQVKDLFRDEIIARTMSRDGRALSEADSVLELRRLTSELNSSDQGKLTEAWYAARRGLSDQQPTMNEATNPMVVGRTASGGRQPDFVDGNELVEVKSTRNGLTPEDQLQIEVDLMCCATGGGVRVGGKTQKAARLRLVFTDPGGALGSCGPLQRWLDNHPELTIEIFGRTGRPTLLSQATLPTALRKARAKTLAELLATL
jgi:hypothetical protein